MKVKECPPHSFVNEEENKNMRQGRINSVLVVNCCKKYKECDITLGISPLNVEVIDVKDNKKKRKRK